MKSVLGEGQAPYARKRRSTAPPARPPVISGREINEARLPDTSKPCAFNAIKTENEIPPHKKRNTKNHSSMAI